MPYGIKVRNQNGELQVDGVYRNYHLYEQGIATDSDSDRFITITFSNSTSLVPVFAIKPISDVLVALDHITRDSDTGLYTGAVFVAEEKGISLSWMALVGGVPDQLSDQYGIKIYGVDGVLLFSSAGRYMKIIGTYDFVEDASQESLITVQNTDDHYFFVYPDSYGEMYDQFNNFTVLLIRGIKKVSTTQVSTGYVSQIAYVGTPHGINAGVDHGTLVEVTI